MPKIALAYYTKVWRACKDLDTLMIQICGGNGADLLDLMKVFIGVNQFMMVCIG
ncbi:hypothetical protein [Moraxella caviae]|uniref:hypothetical protein n=1 Tax=Moraxella caviae TaxID=34060 RepID=UPI001C49AD41|nr:hypothetical protein [Moraxella caviae]